MAKTKTVAEKSTEDVAVEDSVIEDDPSDRSELTEDEIKDGINPDDEEARRQQRQNQWGQQYDVWLIRRSRKKRIVEFLLVLNWPEQGGIVSAVPVRIDKDAVQVQVGEDEPFWIMKSNIASFRESSTNSTPAI